MKKNITFAFVDETGIAHSRSTAKELKQLFSNRFINIEDIRRLLELSLSKRDHKK